MLAKNQIQNPVWTISTQTNKGEMMKKILISVLMLFAFYGCATMDTTPQESRGEALIRMCENEGNEEACQAYFVEARIECNNYNVGGCAKLAYIIYDPQKVDFYVKNISEKEQLKNRLMYTVKACMLGFQPACQSLERLKMTMEDYIRNNP